MTEADQGLDLVVEGIRPSPSLFAKLAAAGASLGAARITVDDESVILTGEPSVTLSGAQVRLPAGAFLQASRESETVLVGLVKEGMGHAKRVADLFAGIGTFTFALAGSAEVDAFEQDEAAITALGQAARATPKLKPVRTFSRDLFLAPLTARELARCDAVVLDPPRAGRQGAGRGAGRFEGREGRHYLMQARHLRARPAHPVDGGYRITRGPRRPVPVLDGGCTGAVIRAFIRLRASCPALCRASMNISFSGHGLPGQAQQ